MPKKPMIADDEIMSLWRTARPSDDQQNAMAYCINGLFTPKHELRYFAELVIEWAREQEAK